jgi:alpha-ribazole phosphatase
MSEILFIRHAETDMAGTFCGHSNPDLNQAGHRQIKELLRSIRNEDICVVYTSDLRRAHTTAKAISKTLDVECRVSETLREISFGQWEGLTWDQIERKDPTYSRRWVTEYPDLPAPGGEIFYEFERRVLNQVKQLSAEAARCSRSIAVVTHAGVLRTVLTKVQGISEELAGEQTKTYCSVIRHANAALVFTEDELRGGNNEHRNNSRR